ncbi:MAG TPA: hypothetical protein VGR59_11970 [Gemmatimonadaceae bacterium]|nr:hypothetical protein [Gemmatimonadaceae bacterium]
MPADPRRGGAHPTAHAVRVFGGALGMVMLVAGICILVAQLGSGDAYARSRITTLGAAAAVLVGGVLVRGAWRAMRARPGGGAP